ncbi:hypothetical protein [Streptomyces sp. NRRL S-448]|uniref:hypothetical protein n=1 Tax=Streptomyces sp. NRRL S-448 TaxID=1463907 RepID=UPI003564680A
MRERADCLLVGAGMDRLVSVKTLRMPEDPEELVDAIAVAVRAGDDCRIGVLLDRFKEVAGLSHLIRLRERLCGAGGAARVTGCDVGWSTPKIR